MFINVVVKWLLEEQHLVQFVFTNKSKLLVFAYL